MPFFVSLFPCSLLQSPYYSVSIVNNIQYSSNHNELLRFLIWQVDIINSTEEAVLILNEWLHWLLEDDLPADSILFYCREQLIQGDC